MSPWVFVTALRLKPLKKIVCQAGFFASLVCVASCVGAIDDEGHFVEPIPGARPAVVSARMSPSSDNSGPIQDADKTYPLKVGAGPLPLRRLGNVEWVNTVVDLLGLPESQRAALANGMPSEEVGVTGFSLPGLFGVSEVMRLGEKARQALKAMPMAALPGCVGTNETACARAFLTPFIGRAFRRPGTPSEIDELVALWPQLRPAHSTYVETLGDLVVAVLQTPQFLYHGLESTTQPPARGDVVPLSEHQLASRLSYFLLRTSPDEALRVAANEGRLTDLVELERQTRRMLGLPGAKDVAPDLYRQLLQIDDVAHVSKNEKTLGIFPSSLRDSMQAEVTSFVKDLWSGSGPVAMGQLLGASHSFVDESLAKHYGVSGISGAIARKATLPGDRAGLLTMGAVMTVTAGSTEPSPIKRGALIRQRFLCQQLPAQPAVVPSLPAAITGVTLRERLDQHKSDPVCKGCHELLEPGGYAFSAYDAVGRWRPLEGDKMVDSSGTLVAVDNGNRSYGNLREFVSVLNGSPELQRCAVRQWFRYALGRPEGTGDEATLGALDAGFSKTGFDLRELQVAIVKSNSFTLRDRSSVDK